MLADIHRSCRSPSPHKPLEELSGNMGCLAPGQRPQPVCTHLRRTKKSRARESSGELSGIVAEIRARHGNQALAVILKQAAAFTDPE